MITATLQHRVLLDSLNGSTDTRRPQAVLPLIAILHQLAEVVRALSDAQYTTKPVGVIPSSIGGHVRHCLDHIHALLAGVEGGAVDYDQRQRGTEVENSRSAALDALRRHEKQLLAFRGCPDHQPLRLAVLLSSSLPPVEVETSVGRELAFVLSHTIHHNALIGAMAKMLGVPVPDRFGYAPATLAHLETTTCAQ